MSALLDSLDDVLWKPMERDEIKSRLFAHLRRIRAARHATRTVDEEERLRERRIDCLRLVAHDLNNPLTAIRILAEMLVNEFDDAEVRQDLADVLEAADLAACIIESMSRMVRLEAPDESMTGFEVDVQRVVAEVLRRPAFNTSCRLVTDSGATSLVGDRNAIQHAINDVLLNARRMCDGKAELEVRVTSREGAIEVECRVPSAWVPSSSREEFTNLFGAVELRAERIPVAASGLAYADYVARYHGGRASVDGVDGITRVRLTFAR